MGVKRDPDRYLEVVAAGVAGRKRLSHTSDCTRSYKIDGVLIRVTIFAIGDWSVRLTDGLRVLLSVQKTPQSYATAIVEHLFTLVSAGLKHVRVEVVRDEADGRRFEKAEWSDNLGGIREGA